MDTGKVGKMTIFIPLILFSICFAPFILYLFLGIPLVGLIISFVTYIFGGFIIWCICELHKTLWYLVLGWFPLMIIKSIEGVREGILGT